ncbi:MAG: hypothetical protein NUV57_03665 [archaeon]|nr:hypothetical protein [archaeon]
MVSMTLSIEEDLRKRMKRHPHIKWSEVARTAIRQQLDDIEKTEKLASESMLNEKDVKELAGKVDREMIKHFEELAHETGY